MKRVLIVCVMSIFFSCSQDEMMPENESLIDNEVYTKVSSPEREALIAIYNANPNATLNWNLSDSNINNWQGVTTNSAGAITQLNLSNKNMNIVPPEIAYLPFLTTLYLNGNNLTELPAQIGKLSKLKRLYVYDNQLSDLPKQMKYLYHLTDLYIGFNNYTDIPAVVGTIKSLKVFNASYNNINSILGSLYKLPNLEILGLYNNNISSISPYIKYLKSTLTELNLGKNVLKSIPKEIAHLVFLKSLHLHFNLLVNVPYQLGNLTQLETLDLRNNPYLSSIPKQVCELNNPPYTYVYLDNWLDCY